MCSLLNQNMRLYLYSVIILCVCVCVFVLSFCSLKLNQLVNELVCDRLVKFNELLVKVLCCFALFHALWIKCCGLGLAVCCTIVYELCTILLLWLFSYLLDAVACVCVNGALLSWFFVYGQTYQIMYGVFMFDSSWYCYETWLIWKLTSL